ncbi:YwdI family protein [Bacillus spongiae]|uniref:YwdI family protein n=1 Tax=Bacillus spongiae TaxID=2683610 RepID=A0ABU8HGD7_9BACI
MNISYHSILSKMEKELQQAKSGGEIRDHLHIIKALCEVILDDTPASTTNVSVVEPIAPQKTTSVTLPEQRALKTDDGANGDSIFDF